MTMEHQQERKSFVSSVVKKYSNRRLYDAELRRCITLAELSAKIRNGAVVKVVDSKSGQDLTPPTLLQILVDERGLARRVSAWAQMVLIRLDDETLQSFLDDALPEALAAFCEARGLADRLPPVLPDDVDDEHQAPESVAKVRDEVADLRREVAALRAALGSENG